MKNIFAVSMTLLLALTLAGSFAGYRMATTHIRKRRRRVPPSPLRPRPAPTSRPPARQAHPAHWET